MKIDEGALWEVCWNPAFLLPRNPAAVLRVNLDGQSLGSQAPASKMRRHEPLNRLDTQNQNYWNTCHESNILRFLIDIH